MKHRGKRGQGRLYKRDAKGKEHKPNSRVRGAFWLEHRVNGVRRRVPLTDENNEPIVNLRDAEKARQRITAPFMASGESAQWEALRAKIDAAKNTEERAIAKAKPPLLLGQAWQTYNDSPLRPDSGERTLSDYRGYLRRFECWLQEEHPTVKSLSDVSPWIAQEYASTLNGGSASANTYNKHICFLRLFFNVLEDRINLDRNPLAGITRHKHRTFSRRELTNAEVHLLLDAGEGDIPLLIGIGAFTGLRLGDSSTLQWANVDLDRRMITRLPNKTARSRPDKAVRIPMIPPLVERLDAIPSEERGEFVIPNIAAQYEADRPGLSRRIQRHFLECEIDTHKRGTGRRIVRDEKGRPTRDELGNVLLEHTGSEAVVEVGFHSLRHTFITRLKERGVPDALIEEMVGHSNPTTTRIYTHISEDALRKSERKISDAFCLTEGSVSGDPVVDPAEALKAVKAAIEKLNGRNWKQIKIDLSAMLKKVEL